MPKKTKKTKNDKQNNVSFDKKSIEHDAVAVFEKPEEEQTPGTPAEVEPENFKSQESESAELQSGENLSEQNEKNEFEWKIHHIQKEPGNYTDELNNKILDYLQKLELISSKHKKLIKEVYRVEARNIADIIQDEKIMKQDEIGSVMADYFSCNYLVLRDTKIDGESIRHIPEEVARNEMALVFKEDEDTVYLAMLNPSDQHFIHLVEKKTGKKTKIYYSTPRQIRAGLKNYKRSLKENIDYLIAQAGQDIERLDSLDNISTIFDTLILMAYDRGASDIHIEPFEDQIRIRFRIDGVMGIVTTLPMHFLNTIVNHVKVLSKLRTDEHSSAQDGRFNITYDQTNIHLRVSILPTHYGEKTVMRLLPTEAQELTLTDLGYLESDKDLIGKEIAKSNGIILVTGPTGSGKTTTLYSLLKKLNEEEVNISTIEDPIEYGLEGVNQIQVNPKTNLTFAKGLKSLLRQDPDILMVGEIRDFETGKIAMNASLTGHLVLSTLHTNSASLAPLRLVQMGVDPYLIVSTVNLIIAQRLVRKICPHCMASIKITKEQIKDFQSQYLMSDEDKELFNKYFSEKKEHRLFAGKGCRKCGDTGYRGRTVIAEVMKMESDIRDLITEQASESEIRETAKKNGMTAMLEDGFQKVLNGVTTLEELFRVVNQ